MIHSPRPITYQRIYQDITEKVMAALRQGNIIWRKPWSSTSNTLPTNFVSKKRYRGWNLFYLSWMMQEKGYTSPYFLTFRQTQLLGGRIHVGNKGLPVIIWVESSNKPATDESDETTNTRHIYPITHIVFNVAQTEGIDSPKPTDPPLAKSNPILPCENLLAQMKQLPLVQPNSDRAAYSKIHDRIFMPDKDSFHPPEEYYSTLFHEIIHSTGHATRLNRSELTGPFSFGSPEYSREELTANSARRTCAESPASPSRPSPTAPPISKAGSATWKATQHSYTKPAPRPRPRLISCFRVNKENSVPWPNALQLAKELLVAISDYIYQKKVF